MPIHEECQIQIEKITLLYITRCWHRAEARVGIKGDKRRERKVYEKRKETIKEMDEKRDLKS